MFDLFGGAISADIPSSFVDASNIRPIPSHQEVFVSSDSNDSIIIEIVELQDVYITDMAEYHLKQVCDSICNVLVEYDQVNKIGAIASLGSGKINEQRIHMMVLRLEKIRTELLISWNSMNDRSIALKDLASTLIVRDWSLFT